MQVEQPTPAKIYCIKDSSKYFCIKPLDEDGVPTRGISLSYLPENYSIICELDFDKTDFYSMQFAVGNPPAAPVVAQREKLDARQWINSKEVLALRWKWADRHEMSGEDALVALLDFWAASQRTEREGQQ